VSPQPAAQPDRHDAAGLALTALLEAHRALRIAFEERVRAATGLSTAEADVLASIARNTTGRQRMVDLADQMYLSKSGGTQLVDRLAEGGLVVREASELDRRLVYAVVTPLGRDVFARNATVVTEVCHQYFADRLDENELHVLADLLRRVAAGPDSDST
jgi:DNA-binding MarR family transcriptional regulator